MARALTSSRPPAKSTRTTASTIGSTRANTIGARAGLTAAPGAANKGQPNANSPATRATVSTTPVRTRAPRTLTSGLIDVPRPEARRPPRPE